MYKLLYPSIRLRTAPPVLVRVRVRVSVSFSYGVTLLRILFCMCPETIMYTYRDDILSNGPHDRLIVLITTWLFVIRGRECEGNVD